MKLLFVRHGKTYFNELDLTQGWCDSPLSDLGLSQAKDLAEKIKDIKVDEAYSSTSERAYDTLEIALNDPSVEIKRDRRLKELNFGYFEGQPNTMKAKMVNESLDDIEHSFDYTPYHGEKLVDVVQREMEFLKEILTDDNKTVAIAGHGCSLSALVYYLCREQLEKEYPEFRMLPNAGGVLVEYKNGEFRLEKFIF